jgi:hypothetical protein
VSPQEVCLSHFTMPPCTPGRGDRLGGCARLTAAGTLGDSRRMHCCLSGQTMAVAEAPPLMHGSFTRRPMLQIASTSSGHPALPRRSTLWIRLRF